MTIKTHRKFDVVVVGGGPAGIGAAVGAARNGARTLIVEQGSFLGGNMTLGYPINGFFSLQGVQVVNGVAEELFQRVVDLDGSPGHVEVSGSFLRTYDLMDAEVVKCVAQEMVLEAGGEILLHAFATGAVMEGNRIRGITIVGKGGQEIIPAEVVIDCSGDADVAASAGAPFQKGRESDGQMQAVTMMFRLNHVDPDCLPEYFTDGLTETIKPGSSQPSFLRGVGNFERWGKTIVDEGVLEKPERAIFANSIRDGEFAANTTRVIGIDATDMWDLTQAEVAGRRQVMGMHAFLKKHVPGFEQSAVIATGPFIGVRETRRILGEYRLTADDVVAGRDFPDNITRCGFPIDIHVPDGSGVFQQFVKDGGSYGIPYRCLAPLEVEQLLVAGRCISATHEAIGSAREMAQCIAMGQAAGTAAAISLAARISPREVDIKALRETLRSQGAVLEESDTPCRLAPLPAHQLEPEERVL